MLEEDINSGLLGTQIESTLSGLGSGERRPK